MVVPGCACLLANSDYVLFTSTVCTYYGLDDERAPYDTTEGIFHPSPWADFHVGQRYYDSSTKHIFARKIKIQTRCLIAIPWYTSL